MSPEPEHKPSHAAGLAAWRRYALLSCVLAITLVAVRWGQSDESPTTDEWAHFTRGVSYWQTGDLRLAYAHPPLANLVATIPAATDESLPRVESLPAWGGSMDAGQLSLQLLDVDYAAAREALMRCRRTMVGFLLVGIAYLFCFVRRLSNDVGAFAAAALIGWNPTVVAHARYVTTDLPAAVTIAIAVCEIALLSRGRGSLARAALAVGLALLTKHSAVVLLPIGAAALLLSEFRPRREPGSVAAPRWATLGRLSRRSAAVGAVCLLCVNAGYGFQRTGMRVDDMLAAPEPDYWISSDYDGELLERGSPLPRLPAAARIPLPYAYVFGLACIREQMRRGYPRGTFLGRPAPHGHWGYFPLLLLLKVPLDLLLALLAGVLVVARARARPRMDDTVRSLAFFTAALLALLLTSRLNMGARHALPQVCLLGVLGGLSVSAVLKVIRSRILAVVALAGLLGIRLAGLVAAGPHYLGWCNALVDDDRCIGVAAAGEDWGQDVAALARNARGQAWSPFAYHDPTHTRGYELAYHGVSFFPYHCGTERPLVPLVVAVHVHEIQIHGTECFPWLDTATLLCSIDHHVRVYRVPGALGSLEPEPTAEDCDDLPAMPEREM